MATCDVKDRVELQIFIQETGENFNEIEGRAVYTYSNHPADTLALCIQM